MSEFILAHEPAVRLGCFMGILALMALWEIVSPRRPLTTSKGARWFRNLSLVAIDTTALRLILPATAVTAALWAERQEWGLLNQILVPFGLETLLGIILLDFAIYLQHAMFHALPALWRLHMVHHTDLDFDVTTGIRFHPVEILLSMGIKIGVVLALGIPSLAVILFEVILNATSLFSHGNVRLPASLDRVLRLFVVTPEMHRVHHSVIIQETNSNFGFNLPWWDRLLGTYRAQPQAGHEGMTIGLSLFRDAARLTLSRLLLLPLVAKGGRYSFN